MQHDAENDENITDDDYDLVSGNENESDKDQTDSFKTFNFLN